MFGNRFNTNGYNVKLRHETVCQWTRITKDNQTIIDLVFANNKIEVQIIHELKITDHVAKS